MQFGISPRLRPNREKVWGGGNDLGAWLSREAVNVRCQRTVVSHPEYFVGSSLCTTDLPAGVNPHTSKVH